MKQIIISICLILVITILGCYKDKEELINPAKFTCNNLSNVSYATDVQPILNSYCLACHDNKSFNTIGGNLDLEDFAELTKVVNSGALLSSIKQDGTTSTMPKGADKLSICNITIIETWINEGAKNN